MNKVLNCFRINYSAKVLLLLFIFISFSSLTLASTYSDDTYGKKSVSTATPIISGANYSINVNNSNCWQGVCTNPSTTYVPYTGATGDVNLGEHNYKANVTYFGGAKGNTQLSGSGLEITYINDGTTDRKASFSNNGFQIYNPTINGFKSTMTNNLFSFTDDASSEYFIWIIEASGKDLNISNYDYADEPTGGNININMPLVSSVETGTAPYQTSSTTLNTNLNADYVDGLHANQLGNTSFNQTLTDASYLKLDQTTPQTVINGIPTFQNGIITALGTKIGTATDYFTFYKDPVTELPMIMSEDGTYGDMFGLKGFLYVVEDLAYYAGSTTIGLANSELTREMGINANWTDEVLSFYGMTRAKFVQTTGGIIDINRQNSSVTANDMVGKIEFSAKDTSTSTNLIVANIEAQATNTITTNINPGRLIFRTTGTEVGATPTERMRITETGEVKIANYLNVSGLIYGNGSQLTGISGGNSSFNQTLTDATYLKLNQTTPQTTVGTFTFPATVVNNQSAFGTTIDSTLQINALGANGSTNVDGKGFKFLSGGSGLNSAGTANYGGSITLQGGIGKEETNAPSGTANGGGGGRIYVQPGNGGKITRVSGTGSVTGGNGGVINYQAGTGGIALASATTNAIGGQGSATTFNSGSPGTGAGGAATATTSGTNTGGVGASFLFNTKAGGAASGGATSTGGASGAARFVLGAGGAATSSAGKAGVGGAGGELTFQGGTGGAVTGAGTTNTGGAGTTVTFTAGVGGTASGASTNTAGANGNIIFNSGSTEVGRFDNTAGAVGNFRLTLDNQKIQLGTAQDFSMYYDGTDGIINPKEVGSGQLKVLGNINATGYNITATDFYSGTSKGLTQSFNMTNASLVNCQMNFTGGILTASNC
jgi:hypothetical protein